MELVVSLVGSELELGLGDLRFFTQGSVTLVEG